MKKVSITGCVCELIQTTKLADSLLTVDVTPDG